jgi:hypothetical protein
MYLENANMTPGVTLLLMGAKKPFWVKKGLPKIAYTVLILQKTTINGHGQPKSSPFPILNVFRQNKLMS